MEISFDQIFKYITVTFPIFFILFILRNKKESISKIPAFIGGYLVFLPISLFTYASYIFSMLIIKSEQYLALVMPICFLGLVYIYLSKIIGPIFKINIPLKSFKTKSNKIINEFIGKLVWSIVAVVGSGTLLIVMIGMTIIGEDPELGSLIMLFQFLLIFLLSVYISVRTTKKYFELLKDAENKDNLQ